MKYLIPIFRLAILNTVFIQSHPTNLTNDDNFVVDTLDVVDAKPTNQGDKITNLLLNVTDAMIEENNKLARELRKGE